MPRRNPLTGDELAIGQRLARFRIHLRLSRQAVGDIAGIPADVLARVELGRMPLRYEDARNILPALRTGRLSPIPDCRVVNPLWLATGEGSPQLQWPLFLPDSDSLNLEPKLPFSRFVAMHRPLLIRLCKDKPDPGLPETWLQPYLRTLMSMELEAEGVYETFALVERLFVGSAEQLAVASNYAARCLDSWRKCKNRRLKDFSTRVLTEVLLSENISGMQDLMQTLRDRLKNATAARGAKGELAKSLGVPLSSISDWLAGRKDPSGKTALRLLQWVEQQEAQQEIKPGSATTLPDPKTQSKASNEKKPQSDQNKH